MGLFSKNPFSSKKIAALIVLGETGETRWRIEAPPRKCVGYQAGFMA